MDAVLVDKSAVVVALVLPLVCTALVVLLVPRTASYPDNQSAGILSLPLLLLLFHYNVVLEVVVLGLVKLALVPVLPILVVQVLISPLGQILAPVFIV